MTKAIATYTVRVEYCTASSVSASDLDVDIMLDTFGTWIGNNADDLHSVFGGDIDNILLFSGKDFNGATVGLAGLGTLCRFVLAA